MHTHTEIYTSSLEEVAVAPWEFWNNIFKPKLLQEMCNRRKNSDLSSHYRTKKMMQTQWKNVGISSKKTVSVYCGNTTLHKSILPTSSPWWLKSSRHTLWWVGLDKTWTQSFISAFSLHETMFKDEGPPGQRHVISWVWHSSLLHHRHSTFISRCCSQSLFLHFLLPIITIRIANKYAFKSWNYSLSRQKFSFCRWNLKLDKILHEHIY